jgi:hypothetical protein
MVPNSPALQHYYNSTTTQDNMEMQPLPHFAPKLTTPAQSSKTHYLIVGTERAVGMNIEETQGVTWLNVQSNSMVVVAAWLVAWGSSTAQHEGVGNEKNRCTPRIQCGVQVWAMFGIYFPKPVGIAPPAEFTRYPSETAAGHGRAVKPQAPGVANACLAASLL